MDNRLEQVRLLEELYSRRDQPEVQLLLKVLDFRLTKVRDRLLECSPAEFQKLQGEAAAYAAIIKDIMRPKPVLRPVSELKEI